MVKVKWSCYRPGVAQRVGRGIALLFHDCGTRRGWVASSMPQPHFTPGKDPVPIWQEAGWAPGPVWMGGKSRPNQDLIPDCPVQSQLLYQLSYPAHIRHSWLVFIVGLRLNFSCESVGSFCSLQQSIWFVFTLLMRMSRHAPPPSHRVGWGVVCCGMSVWPLFLCSCLMESFERPYVHYRTTFWCQMVVKSSCNECYFK